MMNRRQKGQNVLCQSEIRDIAVRIIIRLLVNDRAIGVRTPAGARDFLFSTAAKPALGPTQCNIQRILGVLSRGLNGLDSKLHTVPSLKMRTEIQPPPHTCSWHCA
jgi:hypothetical protein